MSFLPCWPIGFITSSLGLLRSIYFTFTSCCAHRLASCHSCPVGPLGLLPIFLGFHSPFTLLFHLIVPMGLLAIVLAVLAHWVYYLFSQASTAHLLYFSLFHFHFSLTFSYCWASSAIMLFEASTINTQTLTTNFYRQATTSLFFIISLFFFFLFFKEH